MQSQQFIKETKKEEKNSELLSWYYILPKNFYRYTIPATIASVEPWTSALRDGISVSFQRIVLVFEKIICNWIYHIYYINCGIHLVFRLH